MRELIGRVVLLAGGIAMAGSAVLHGVVNVPHLHEDLVEIGVRRTLVGAVVLVLYFSVAAMFTFGGIVLASVVASFRGSAPQRSALWIIGAMYVVFGVAAFALVSRSPHFLGYALMGALVAAGAALCTRRAPLGA